MKFVLMYDLQKEERYIQDVQKATLETENYGVLIENNLLFGTKEWFETIANGKIKTFQINGVITNTRRTGQNNDTEQFEITENLNSAKEWWNTRGKSSFYKIGKKVKLKYVMTKAKKPDPFYSGKQLLTLEVEE